MWHIPKTSPTSNSSDLLFSVFDVLHEGIILVLLCCCSFLPPYQTRQSTLLLLTLALFGKRKFYFFRRRPHKFVSASKHRRLQCSLLHCIFLLRVVFFTFDPFMIYCVFVLRAIFCSTCTFMLYTMRSPRKFIYCFIA